MRFQLPSQWCAGDARAKWWARSFAIASIFHVALPDFEHSSWIVPRMLIWVSALLLLWRPMPVMFLLNAFAHLITLFVLRDVLTQSVMLLIFAIVGARLSLTWSSRQLHSLSLVTAVTYLMATVHKLNRSFMNSETSCSVHAVTQVLERWQLSWPSELNSFLPGLTIIVELSLALMLTFRSRWYWLFAFGFHLPLVVTLAPAFGAVVLCGATAGLTARDLVSMRAIVRQKPWRWVLVFFGVIVTEGYLSHSYLSVWQHGQVGWYALVCGAAFLAGGQHKNHVKRHIRLAVLWLGFCMTPYFGVQVQHTGAMLSNLRVDTECHNSLIFSPDLVLEDQYMRVNTVSFGTEKWASRARILEAGLWNEAALSTMKRNWCVPWARPIAMTVVYRAKSVVIADLCDTGSLDFFSPSQRLLSGYQRFQKNLTRSCSQSCIH
jgi:hypothetical protein